MGIDGVVKLLGGIALAAASMLFAYLAMPDRFVDLLIAVAGIALGASIPFIYAALFEALER